MHFFICFRLVRFRMSHQHGSNVEATLALVAIHSYTEQMFVMC